jgi:hypothetical protein
LEAYTLGSRSPSPSPSQKSAPANNDGGINPSIKSA